MLWNEGLNTADPAYRIASFEGSLLRVMAGPGTGKSFALKRKVAKLLEQGVDPRSILVVTFTRTAAKDLEKELRELAVPGVDKVVTGTLHAFCFSLLQKARVFDFTRRMARPLLEFEQRFLLEDLNNQDVFGNFHERRRRIQALAAAWAREQEEEPGVLDETDRLFAQHLEEWLLFHEAVLLAELVPITLRYLRSNPNRPERRQFDHVLVDEYQDLNKAEQSLIDLLSESGTLTVVGDEDQSIYEDFRYAHPEGISVFDSAHPGTCDEALEECRRCPQQVVVVANELIRNNMRRTNRDLLVRPENVEGCIHVVQWDDIQSEANGIADYVTASGFDPGDTLILSPSREFGYGVRDALRERGIATRSFFTEQMLEGNPKELEKCGAQEAFTVLTLIADPEDRVALRCFLGFGQDALERNSYAQVRQHTATRGRHPREVMEDLSAGSLTLPGTNGIVTRYRLLKEKLAEAAHMNGRELLESLFPAHEEWSEAFRAIAEAENITETTSANELLASLHTNIIQPELPTDVPYVRVMSLHKSKGLGAKLVIVIGCIEGLIPRHPKEDNPFEQKQRYIEEQRRLFYVAITRARHTLVLSSVLSIPRDLAHKLQVPFRNRGRENADTITSTFIGELGPHLPQPIPGRDWIY